MKDRLDLLLTSWMKQHPVSAAQAKLLQLLLISAVTWTGRNPQALLMLAWSVTHLSSATSSLPQKPLRTRWESWRHMSVQTIQEEGQNSDLDCSRDYVRKRFLNAARDPYHLVILSSRNFLRAAASLATTLTDLSVRSVFLTDSLLLGEPQGSFRNQKCILPLKHCYPVEMPARFFHVQTRNKLAQDVWAILCSESALLMFLLTQLLAP